MTRSMWMVSNGDRLVEAIQKDGCYNGPLSSPILDEMIKTSIGDVQTARSIFKDKMIAAGLQDLIPFNALENIVTAVR